MFTIANGNAENGCVDLHSGWAHPNTSRFSKSTCAWSLLVGGNFHPGAGDDAAVVSLGASLNVSRWELRRCAMRFSIQLQPGVVAEADRHLKRVRGGDASVVVIGIHIRAARFNSGMASGGDTGAAHLNDDAVFQPRGRKFQFLPSVFEPYADAARRLEHDYTDAHGANSSVIFKWIVLSDSVELRSELQRRWDHAVPFDAGPVSRESQKESCSSESGQPDPSRVARVEWLVLTKCDLLVVSHSGFSFTAAAFREPLAPTTVVASFKGNALAEPMSKRHWIDNIYTI